ncbi:MAG: PhoX family phosphatase [Rhodocyclales bacterium]|nr:PhoX family phosphatase [Rhodocyclales bacterium]
MKCHDDDLTSNTTTTASFGEIVDRRRRSLLTGAIAGAMLGAMPPGTFAAPRARRGGGPVIGFKGIAASSADELRVPQAYAAQVVFAWGDPVGDGPEFLPDASNTAADQRRQAGMHHDGMHFFPLAGSSVHGLLCVNHEYTDDGLLHSDGMRQWSAEKVAKAQAAHGVSIIEIRRERDSWQLVRGSRYARRITAETPIAIAGPAAGNAAMHTAADPRGRLVLGTINNCAIGVTPWGSYLTCEENFNGYFRAPGDATPEQRRYGISAKTAGYRWHEHDERFDLEKHPNEANRFGWVVEIDPMQPDSMPVKRTALGRIKHEGAFVTLARDRRVVVYMGDDERFEYIYKFVSTRPCVTGQSTSGLLDEGTLYVARFGEDGTGRWLPLTHGEAPLTADNGFVDQADVLIRTRQAADKLGATRMDRPEWIAVHPQTGEVYCSLTNNAKRGSSDVPGLNAANRRAGNLFGHILRWREAGGDAAAAALSWEVFVECGDPELGGANLTGNIKGDLFASPDGLWFDRGGRLWIQTDVSTSVLGDRNHAAFGNNQMLVADPVSGDVRRFLTGPRGCEITGITSTPDRRTLFVNVQHPGETASERSNPDQPLAVSAWPGNQFPALGNGRPRSATVAIRRLDGGEIGAVGKA